MQMLRIKSYELLGSLPDPFLFDNGARMTDPSQWQARRKELLKTAVELQYGRMLPQPEFVNAVCCTGEEMPVQSYVITTGTLASPVRIRMTVFKPAGPGPFPTVVDGDLCFADPYDRDFIHAFTDNGIALALFDRTELFPDRKDAGRDKSQVHRAYPSGDYGAIAAWAWGYSRCVDALEQTGLADMDRIVFTGHSRGGKTAALAGVLDERAAIVNPNETCAGACGCYRIHMSAITEDGELMRSETLDDLMAAFGFWMGPGMKEYVGREADLPFDCHFLKALIAPRVLYDSEAVSDIWANPVGSWQTTMAATEVYRYLGVPQNIYWSFRKGYHGHKPEDAKRLVSVIRHHFFGEQLSEDLFRLPFEKIKPAFDWTAPPKGEEQM